MYQLLRRLALPVAVTSIAVNTVMLAVSVVIWWLAIKNEWLESVAFVSHVSMLALVFSAVSGVAAAIAGVIALLPTDDVITPKGGEDGAN
jgi:hypothetical protein